MKWLILLILIYPFSLGASGERYGTYSLFPHGSTRVLGMGGAFTGLANDASGVHHNPAGLVKAQKSITLAGGRNEVTNAGEGFSIDAYNFDYTALALARHPIAIGAARSVPYKIPTLAIDDALFFRGNLSISSWDGSLSIALSKRLSIGVTIHYEELEQKLTSLQSSGTPTEEVDRQAKWYGSVGISYWPKPSYGFGAQYIPERIYDVTEREVSFNSVVVGSFRGAVIPHRLTVGTFFPISKRMLFVMDVDVIGPVKNAYLPRANNKIETAPPIDEKIQMVAHGGFEYYLLKSKNLELTLRGGGYHEPSRVPGVSSRNHLTTGFEIRRDILSLSLALDRATGYSNVAFSLGLAIL